MNHDQFVFLCACVLAGSSDAPTKLIEDLNGALKALQSEPYKAAFPVLAGGGGGLPGVIDVVKTAASLAGVVP